MKKISIISIILLVAMVFTACGHSGAVVQDDGDNDERLHIVCTVFPVYDWITEIIGADNQRISVRLLGEKGDIHSYQPSVQDVAVVALSDLLVFVGGESDKWVEKTVNEQGLNTARLFDVNKDMLIDDDHSHSVHSHESHEAEGFDEHLWLSLRMAERSVRAISDAICLLDKENAEKYRKNTEEYCQKLAALDESFEDVAEKAQGKTIIFADRFPFGYMMKDYGIQCVSAFPGCSTDENATFETVTRMIEALDSHQTDTILVLENSDRAVAETVIENSKREDVEIEVLNSCQSARIGDDYLEIMEGNLKVLKKVLK